MRMLNIIIGSKKNESRYDPRSRLYLLQLFPLGDSQSVAAFVFRVGGVTLDPYYGDLVDIAEP